MTDTDLDKMDAALAARLRIWLVKALALIREELDAAKAHAEIAVTAKLKATPDGRPSARRLNRSRSYQSSLSHIKSLQNRLCGASSQSLDGLVRDARAAFYRDSVALWKPHISPEFLVISDPVPTVAGERLMRGAIIHGYDLRRELDVAFQTTRNHLFVALNSAVRKGATSKLSSDRLGLWHRQAIERIGRKVAQALSDSDKAIHEATGRLLIAPEYREQIPNPASGGIHL